MAVASDLEGTLTTGEPWRGLGRYLLEHGGGLRYRSLCLAHAPAAVMARLGVVDSRSFASRWVADLLSLFRGMTVAEFAAVAAWVVDRELWPRRREEVIASLRVHQAAGERIVLVSGTYQPVLEAFAARMVAELPLPGGEGVGIDAIGTPLELRDGLLTGRLVTPLNVADTKAQRLHDTLARERLYAAYGDTEADIPMLLLGDRPVAVYPDDGLRRTARELGWTILEPEAAVTWRFVS